MGTGFVVEGYGDNQRFNNLANKRKPHTLQKLILHRVVDTFGLWVLLWIPVLSHADSYVIFFKQLHIALAGILKTAA